MNRASANQDNARLGTLQGIFEKRGLEQTESESKEKAQGSQNPSGGLPKVV